MAHEPRLLIEQRLEAGASLSLDEERARHVGVVLRRGPGESLRVFNANDGEWRARVSDKTKRGMRVRVEAFLRAAQPAPDLELLFAPVKRHATDLIVEKATELGVRRIRPVITQHTIAETVRIERLQTIAREAAEQTERFDAPEIRESISLAKILDGWADARALIYADEGGDDAQAPWGGERGRAEPLLAALQRLRPAAFARAGGEGGAAASPQAGVSLLIGPEGGFAAEERRLLRALAFVMPVSLGPRILRAETAAIAALAVIQAVWGDWRTP